MREILKNQMLAALATLNQCVENCPEREWNESHGDAPFSQVVFHTLFYLDYYLSRNPEEFRTQKFHNEHREIFRDYEELEDREPREIYTGKEIETYINFCHNKIENCFNGTDKNYPLVKAGHRNMTIMELAIYNTRHGQHHAAQLGLLLQQITSKTLKWVSGGYSNLTL
jgi:hypothetical protein